MVPTYFSSHFVPTTIFPIYILTRTTSVIHCFPHALALSKLNAFVLAIFCPTMPFFASPSSKFLSPFETYIVKPSWFTCSDTLSLITLLCHYIKFQLFVCMFAFVLRQGAPWKLVLIFWCLNRIGKNANSPWCCLQSNYSSILLCLLYCYTNFPFYTNPFPAESSILLLSGLDTGKNISMQSW